MSSTTTTATATGRETLVAEIYDQAHEHWQPNRVDIFRQYGLTVVLGKRDGYEFEDLETGRRIINMHINGGVFNLRHCNPEVRQALISRFER